MAEISKLNSGLIQLSGSRLSAAGLIRAVVPVAFLGFIFSVPALADIPDSPAERQKAVARYFQVAPVKRAVEDTLNQMLMMQMPPQQRDAYVKQTMAGMRLDAIEQAASDSMQHRFTAGEINALTDFLQTPEGRSAMDKMRDYTADIMPVFQQEVMRAMRSSGAVYPGENMPNYGGTNQPQGGQPGYPGAYGGYPGAYQQQGGYQGAQPPAGQPMNYPPQAGRMQAPPQQGPAGYPGGYPQPQQGYGGYPQQQNQYIDRD